MLQLSFVVVENEVGNPEYCQTVRDRSRRRHAHAAAKAAPALIVKQRNISVETADIRIPIGAQR